MYLQFLHNSEQLMINDTFDVVFNYTLLATNDHPRYLSVIENTSGSFSNSYAFILTVWFEYTILVNVLQRFMSVFVCIKNNRKFNLCHVKTKDIVSLLIGSFVY